jgi:hypothetical protein
MNRKRPSSTAPTGRPTQRERWRAQPSKQNVEPLSESRAFTHRWWLATPGNDESLRSLVERADRLYGKPPQEGYAWQSRPYEEESNRLDAPTSRELVRLARMLGTSPRHLHSHCLEDGPHLLETSERRAYCPRCLQEDRAAGRPRTFRRTWARVLVVSCAEHGTPLHWAEPRLAAAVNFDLEPSLPALAEKDWEVVRLIDTFAQTLEACLWGDASWPTEWRGSPHAARALLIRCLNNLSYQRASPPVAQLWVPSSLISLIGFSSRRLPPLSGVPWEAVRRVGRPAWRRAALWLVAAQVIPGIPERNQPETIPTAYLAATDQWWEDFSPSPHTQKLRRVHAALRGLCAPFPINQMRSPLRKCSSVKRRRSPPDI